MPGSRKLKKFDPADYGVVHSDKPPTGDIFKVADELLTPVPSMAETNVMLREMLEAVLSENTTLSEKILELQNELDRERAKKLQTP